MNPVSKSKREILGLPVVDGNTKKQCLREVSELVDCAINIDFMVDQIEKYNGCWQIRENDRKRKKILMTTEFIGVNP